MPHQTKILPNKISHIILLGIVLLAAALRLWRLAENPPGLIPDEANYAYQAYSILTTGKTMYGTTDFLAFPQYANGWYPPLYTYVLMPFINIFGLSLFTERLPSALFGTLVSVLVYLVVKRLFHSRSAALLGAFLVAINPWALFYSRQGRFEMIGMFLVLSGVVLFLEALHRKELRMYALSALSFGLSLHANDAAKIVSPLLVIGLMVYAGRLLPSWKKGMGLYVGIFGVFFALMLHVLFVNGQINNYTRAKVNTDVSRKVNYERDRTTAPLWLSSIFHNKATVILHRYIVNYTGIFSLHWFFVSGNGDMQESVGRHGQYHLFELPLFFWGLIIAAKKKRVFALLLWWLAISHIPTAITSGPFAPYRSILLLPVPIIFSGLGAAALWEHMRKLVPLARALSVMTVFGIVAAYTISFLFTYFFDFPVYSSDWRYKQRTDMLSYALANERAYEQVFVNGNFSLEYAFLSALHPTEYQRAYQASLTREDRTMQLGKYTFGDLTKAQLADPATTFADRTTLILTDGGVLPKHIKRVRTFVGVEPLQVIYEAAVIR